MTDEEILQSIVEGGIERHEKALDALYERWSSAMKSFFIAKGCPPKDVEDLFQDVVVKIWRNAGQYRRKGSATSWLWALARNALNDRLRNLKREPPSDRLTGDDTDPLLVAPPLYDEHHDDCVADGIARFAGAFPDRAYALELWSIGTNLSDIASIIGRPYGATRQFLMECRKKIRPFLEPCMDTTHLE